MDLDEYSAELDRDNDIFANQAAEIKRLESLFNTSQDELIEVTDELAETKAQLAVLRAELVKWTGWNDDQIAVITDAGKTAAEVLAAARMPMDKEFASRMSVACTAYRAATEKGDG